MSTSIGLFVLFALIACAWFAYTGWCLYVGRPAANKEGE
jgi:hypothetical protein